MKNNIYITIMKDVSKIIKRHINEMIGDSIPTLNIIKVVDVNPYGKFTVYMDGLSLRVSHPKLFTFGITEYLHAKEVTFYTNNQEDIIGRAVCKELPGAKLIESDVDDLYDEDPYGNNVIRGEVHTEKWDLSGVYDLYFKSRNNKSKSLTEMARPSVLRTIDKKLWLTVSSIISRNRETEAEFIKPVGNPDKETLIQRYVAALLIMKKPCPNTIKDIETLKTFKLVGKRILELGGTVKEIQDMYNQNTGSSVPVKKQEVSTPGYKVTVYKVTYQSMKGTSRDEVESFTLDKQFPNKIMGAVDYLADIYNSKYQGMCTDATFRCVYYEVLILDLNNLDVEAEVSIEKYKVNASKRFKKNGLVMFNVTLDKLYANPLNILSSNRKQEKWYIDYYPTWDKGRHDDLQHAWVTAYDKSDAISVARDEVDDLGEIIRVYKR